MVVTVSPPVERLPAAACVFVRRKVCPAAAPRGWRPSGVLPSARRAAGVAEVPQGTGGARPQSTERQTVPREAPWRICGPASLSWRVES